MNKKKYLFALFALAIWTLADVVFAAPVPRVDEGKINYGEQTVTIKNNTNIPLLVRVIIDGQTSESASLTGTRVEGNKEENFTVKNLLKTPSGDVVVEFLSIERPLITIDPSKLIFPRNMNINQSKTFESGAGESLFFIEFQISTVFTDKEPYKKNFVVTIGISR